MQLPAQATYFLPPSRGQLRYQPSFISNVDGGVILNHWPVSDIPIKNAWSRGRILFQRPRLPAPFLSIPVLQSTWSILLILLAHQDLCPLNGASYHNFYSPHDETWCGVFNHSVGLEYTMSPFYSPKSGRHHCCRVTDNAARATMLSPGIKMHLPRDFMARCVLSRGLSFQVLTRRNTKLAQAVSVITCIRVRPASNLVETPDILRVKRFTTVLAGKYWESNLSVSNSLFTTAQTIQHYAVEVKSTTKHTRGW